MSGSLAIEVAYARPDRQIVLPLRVEPGTTLGEAIARSGVLARFPEIDLSKHRVGVFGRVRGLNELVGDGDRVEIYRPLMHDPKLARRRRAARRP